GDLAFRQKATERIQEMMERAKAVIIVTHSMHFVEQVCTRALWIDKGRLRFDGDAEEAVKLYREAMGVNVPKRKKRTGLKKKTAPKK
ncbi:MAG TPA: ABC transporter ATP-binding protein, partial [Candidatus Pseudogracilibacillus intestinigallinarum]|nr:ABC transporter ATP-binding protein [Candidatus Pseudogracilibacillus intestinigallinarum]